MQAETVKAEDLVANLGMEEIALDALFRDAVTGMVVLSTEGRFVLVNPAFCRLVGYSENELLGLGPSAITHPGDRERSRDIMDRLLSGELVTDLTAKRYVRRDGTVVPVVRTTTILRDCVAAPVGLFTQVVDMTEVTDMQETLRASEERLRALLENATELTVLVDREGRITYASPASWRILGVGPEEVQSRGPFEFLHPDDLERAHASFARHLATPDGTHSVEYRARHSDGSWRDVEIVVTNLLDDPVLQSLVLHIRDVSEQSGYRRRLEASNAQQHALAALSSAALRGGPVETLVVDVLETVRRVLGSPHCFVVRYGITGEGTVLGATSPAVASELFPSGPGQKMCPLAAEAYHSRRAVVWNAGGEGDEQDPPLEKLGIGSAVAVPVVPASEERGVLAVYAPAPGAFSDDDVTFLEAVANVLASAVTRRIMESELRRRALNDDLTGLPNRVLLLDRLSTAVARLGRHGGHVAVLFVDVDNFKLVNDSLGHSVGDSVVAAVATRLRAAVRSSDTVARFGGDEFAVVSEDTDPAGARLLAERIRHAVAVPIEMEGQTISITASVGCALTAEAGTFPDDLIADADMAMYEAKQSGKDSVAVFAPHMRRRTTEQMEAISGIRRGLAEREFDLYFQPIFDLTTEAISGYEALARWNHPTAGVLGPAHFIPHAESCGLILPLGEWVLRRACEQSAEWRRSGRVSSVAINISAYQLTGTDLVGLVREVLEESGADPADISLEVTENLVMADMERASVTLRSLRDLGVHVGMDDFGTGQSSLSQLARLPFDFVKIDRSFVRDLDTDERASTMLDSIAALCEALRLPAVVEGVETEAQLARIGSLPVRFIQGFLFGRPQPAGQLDVPLSAPVG